MEQHAAQHHGQVRIAFEFFSRRIGQQDRQEIKRRIRHKIQGLIRGSRLVHQAERRQKRQNRLNHTGRSDSRKDRCKNAGKRVDQLFHNLPVIFFLLGRLTALPCRHFAQLRKRPVNAGYIASDYHLVLAALTDNAHDAVYLFECLRLCFSFIL